MGAKNIKLAIICIALLATACNEQRFGKNLVIVLPDEDGKVGAVAVNDGNNEILLDTANSAAKIGADGKVESVDVTEADISTIFGQTLDALPIPPSRFRLYFIEGTDQLTVESLGLIDGVLADITRRQVYDVEIVGHTDTVGQEDANSKLSLKRAYEVRDWLITEGVEAAAINSYGRGEWDLYIKTEDNIDEPQNRRVEIIVR